MAFNSIGKLFIMLDQLGTQPIWIQVVVGVFVFFGIILVISALINGYLDIREKFDGDSRRRNNREDASRDQSKRECELIEAEPNLLEEAMFIRYGRRRSIYSIREQLNALPQCARDNLSNGVAMQDLFEEIRNRRSGERNS